MASNLAEALDTDPKFRASVIEDITREAARDSQAARWSLDDARALECRLRDDMDVAYRAELQKRLKYHYRVARSMQERSSRFYAYARGLRGVE